MELDQKEKVLKPVAEKVHVKILQNQLTQIPAKHAVTYCFQRMESGNTDGSLLGSN